MRTLILSSLAFSGILLSSISSTAQKVIDITSSDAEVTGQGLPLANFSGEAYSLAKFVRVTQGTPFFNEQWMKGNLTLNTGQAYLNLAIRLNLLDNTVNYKDAKGTELIAVTPLKRIKLRDTIAGLEYNFVYGSELNTDDKSLQRTWFQVLVNNKVSLCKQIRKVIHETTPYGSATTEESIYTNEIYFLYRNKTFVQLKKWSDLLELLKDKKAQLDPFISNNHIKGKTDQDYIQVVNYFNSLQPPGETAAR